MKWKQRFSPLQACSYAGLRLCFELNRSAFSLVNRSMASESPTRNQFTLLSIFAWLAAAGLLLALIGFAMRPVPGRVPEAAMMQSVETVTEGMTLEEVTKTFGFAPSASWVDEDQCGYVCWRFEVSDVNYADSRASYFAELEHGVFRKGFLLYPLESAGGGMRF